MTSNSNYGLDDLYRSMPVAEEKEKDTSSLFEELYRASPVAQKVITITEPTYRSPKKAPVVSLKARLFKQLKTKTNECIPSQTLKTRVVDKQHSTVEPMIRDCDELLVENVDRLCGTQDAIVSTSTPVSSGPVAELISGELNPEDLSSHENLTEVPNTDTERSFTEKENRGENISSTNQRAVSSNSLSVEKHESSKEPVANLMAAFLLTSAPFRGNTEPQGDGPPSHMVRRVEAVKPFQQKDRGIKPEGNPTKSTEDVPEQKTKEPKEYKLQKWIVRLASSGGLLVDGYRPDADQMWHSSKIVKRISHRRVSTAGGSIYILLGPMSKQEAREQDVPEWLIKIFKDGFPVAWKELLQQGNEARLKETSKQKTKVTIKKEPEERTNLQSENAKCHALNQFKPNMPFATPQVKDSAKQVQSDILESPSVQSVLDTPKMQTPSHGKNGSKEAVSSSVKKEPAENSKPQSSFLHYKPGDVVSFDDLPKTRSGRKVVPQLSWWTGQRLFTDKCNTTTVSGPFSPDLSVLDVTVHVSKRQERSIERARKKPRVLNKSRGQKKGSGSRSEGVSSSMESDITSLPDSSCVDSDLGEDDQKVKLVPRIHTFNRGGVRGQKKGKRTNVVSDESSQQEEPLAILDRNIKAPFNGEKGNIHSKVNRLGKSKQHNSRETALEPSSSENKAQKLTDNAGYQLSTPKRNTGKNVPKKEESGKFSVRKTRSMTGARLKTAKPAADKQDGPGTKRGEKKSKSVNNKSRKSGEAKNKPGDKGHMGSKQVVTESEDILTDDSSVIKTSNKRKSSSTQHRSNIKVKSESERVEGAGLNKVKTDVLLNSSLFVDSDSPQNSLVCEDDFLSGDSQFEVRSDIMGMLEARRKMRLSNHKAKQKPTCYSPSPHLHINNIVQTNNHSDKYYLKKALLHHMPREVKDKVAKDSPVVELVSMQAEGVKNDRSKKKHETTKKRNITVKKEPAVNVDNSRKSKQKQTGNNADKNKQKQTTNPKSKTKVKGTQRNNENIKGKKVTLVNPKLKMDALMQPQKEAWTKQEIERLRRATYEVPDYLPNYWELVGKMVQTRTAEECYSHHYSSMHSGTSSSKGKANKTQADKVAATSLTGRVGTLKRKRELREIMENHNQDYDGDFFDSTPYRNNKRVKLDITENDDFFSQVDAMFTTPGVKGRGSWPISEKTPLPNFISPGILKIPNRNDADVYINRMKKAKHVFQKSKNALPATTSKPVSRPPKASATGVKVNSDWFTVDEEVDEEDEEGDSDLYFSDDTSV